jgi:hypothetical protein
MASFETIFLLCARKTMLGIFFTHSMTLLDRTRSEKSNGVGFRAIRHTVKIVRVLFVHPVLLLSFFFALRPSGRAECDSCG